MIDKPGLFGEIDRHFLAPEAQRRAELFARAGRHTEGWFRGELAFLFDSLAKDGKMVDWRADVPVTEDGRQRCDFRLSLEGAALWLEAKALFNVDRQADVGVLFLKSSGFTDDLVKLLRVSEGDRAVLLFVAPRPGEEQWSELISGYARRVAPISFVEESDITAYPEALYVCKLALKGGF